MLVITKIHITIKYSILRKCYLEKNPKWLLPELRSQYYGFHDIVIYVVKNTYISSINLHYHTALKCLEVFIPEYEAVPRDIDDIAKFILAGKIFLQHKIRITDKPVYWLSILCYMLDGGEVRQSQVQWEKKS